MMKQENEQRLWIASRFALLAIGVAVVAGALNVGAVVFIPLVASLLLCLMLWPVFRWLRRFTPKWLAAAVCSLATVAVIAGGVLWGWYAVDAAIQEFERSSEEYIEQYQSAREWLADLGIPASSLPTIGKTSDSGTDGEQTTADADVLWSGETAMSQERWREIRSIIVGGLRSVLGVVAALLLTVFLLFLAFYESEGWNDWTRRHFSPEKYSDFRALALLWSTQTRRYFIAKTISGFISGGATALWLWFMDVPLPIVWGVLTLLMNYIPNIGAFISGVPPTILAVVQLGWTQGLIVAAGLVAIETLVGNLLDPLLEGNMLRLSTFFVLASLLFWGWLWGIAGAIMAPVLSAIIVSAVQRWMRVTAGDRPAPG